MLRLRRLRSLRLEEKRGRARGCWGEEREEGETEDLESSVKKAEEFGLEDMGDKK